VAVGGARSLPVVQVVDAAAGDLPAVGHEQTNTDLPWPFGSPALARPGQGKTQGEPPARVATPGRGCCVELTIPASPAHLAGLRQAARHALRRVPPQVADELVLALDEATTNAILYGSRGGDPVQVAVHVQGAWIEATVLDHGPAQPPQPSRTTDQLSGHGRGLWLLDCLVDEVRLERVKLGTRVTLRRRIRSPSRPTGGGRQPSAGHPFS
jgi:anti-sigma regulatory factor (Ser/Thr protein kinase)